MLNCYIDRFGEDIQTAIHDIEHFTAIVNVVVSPTFYGWVFSFGGKMKIVFPDTVIGGYRALLKNVP